MLALDTFALLVRERAIRHHETRRNVATCWGTCGNGNSALSNDVGATQPMRRGMSGVAANTTRIGTVLVDDVDVLARGLEYPEGPVYLDDGSVLLVEIDGGRVTRVRPGGSVDVVALCGSGANGAALGPDGFVYVCNSGGRSDPEHLGCIQRVSLDDGSVSVLYEACDGRHLLAPNDLVFDDQGNFWFTDLGKLGETEYRWGAIHYASPGGGCIERAWPRAHMPNGIALSPDGATLYWAETMTGRVAKRSIAGPGALEDPGRFSAEGILCGLSGLQYFDSMAIDPAGNIAVATPITGCVTVIEPSGRWIVQLLLPDALYDPVITNICFGGPRGDRAFVTLGETGTLVAFDWPKLP